MNNKNGYFLVIIG